MQLKYERKRFDLGIEVKWYYGWAYMDFERLVEVYYVIPLHWLMRLVRAIAGAWHKMRGQQSSTDFYIMVHSARIAREMATKWKTEAGAALTAKVRKLEQQNRELRQLVILHEKKEK